MKPYKILSFLILVVNGIWAQPNTIAKISSVSKSGLHRIILPAEIRSFSKADLSDFRIFDSKGIEVPYYILEGNNNNTSSHFSEFKMLSRIVIPRKRTSIIIENPKKSISEIVLSISNTDVKKNYSISGSNDQKEWFGLINKAVLSELESNENTNVFKTIPLPLSSYRYLKIDLDDTKTLAINILKAGVFTTQTIKANPVEIKVKKSQTMEILAHKKSLIHITFDYPQIINQINFSISNPSLFQRNARIYVNKETLIKQKIKTLQETLFDFELNSNHNTVFKNLQFFEKDLFVEIENQDNQPLTVAKIQFYQYPIAVIADLKAKQNYSIQTTNPKLNRPQYDLENFKNNIETNLATAKIYEIKKVASTKVKNQSQSFWQESWFMWLCIGVGGIAIAFFSNNMVKDIKE